MQTDNRLLDDLSRIATGALGALQGVKGEVEQAFRQRLERALAEMELVSREEFEAVKAMAEAAREENIRLAERLAALESK
ncbi:accessory factor UbiK family protein [Ferrovibrio terrae]|uniref:accessory factor UbiK family protein n=1 Tax=Ferrovibrio terrae TaxID=2594003 RepID=UPI003138175D